MKSFHRSCTWILLSVCSQRHAQWSCRGQTPPLAFLGIFFHLCCLGFPKFPVVLCPAVFSKHWVFVGFSGWFQNSFRTICLFVYSSWSWSVTIFAFHDSFFHDSFFYLYFLGFSKPPAEFLKHYGFVSFVAQTLTGVNQKQQKLIHLLPGLFPTSHINLYNNYFFWK